MSDALFSIERNHTGRHSEMLEKAIDAARVSGVIEDIDEAMISIARANALGLDAAEKSDKPYYAIAQLTGPYREVLEALRMTPATRESEVNDELNLALAELSKPAVRS